MDVCDPATACTLLGYAATALTGSGGLIVYLWKRVQSLLDQSVKREQEIAAMERKRAESLEQIMWSRSGV